jgi:alcohol dehydrogenase
MSYASYLSGIVLANAGLGTVHGMASALGGFFPIPHGVVCALLMAPVNRLTLARLRETGEDSLALSKYHQLGEMIAAGPLSATAGQDRFIAYLEELASTLGIGGLGDFGLTQNDYDRVIGESSNKYNPVQLDQADFTSILQQLL